MKSTGVGQQKIDADSEQALSNPSDKLPVEFVGKLRERSCGTLSYSDFVRTAGEFIAVREGRVEESDPHTRMARAVLDVLTISAMSSRAFLAKIKKLAVGG